jgi:hypothetical protein
MERIIFGATPKVFSTGTRLEVLLALVGKGFTSSQLKPHCNPLLDGQRYKSQVPL